MFLGMRKTVYLPEALGPSEILLPPLKLGLAHFDAVFS